MISNPIYPTPVHLAMTRSTSDVLRQMSAQGEANDDLTSVIADFQSAGRGQLGNSWESQDGKNLLISTIIHPADHDVARQFLISMAAALAVRDAVCAFLPQQLHNAVKIKWPNDVYVNDLKISGILVENQLRGRLISESIIGVGLNVNQVDFSHAPNPASIKMFTATDTPIADVADSFLRALRLRADAMSDPQLARDFWNCLYRADGDFHAFTDANGRFLARIASIDPDGRLHLELQDHSRRSFLFKEVEYVIPSSRGDITPNILPPPPPPSRLK